MPSFMQKGDECMMLFLEDAADTIRLFRQWESDKMIFDEVALLYLLVEAGAEVFWCGSTFFQTKGQTDAGAAAEFNSQDWDTLLWSVSLNFLLKSLAWGMVGYFRKWHGQVSSTWAFLFW